jgi:hypothetical protein
LLILLAHVVQIDDEGFLLRFLWQAEIPLLRLGAALGILRIGTNIQYLEEALRIYFDALRWGEECRDQIPTDPSWLWAGELWFLLNIWSDQFTPEARSAFRRCLPAALPALPEYAASELARLNMRIGFDQDNLPKSKAELTPVQWALLEALARDTNVLHNDPLILGVLYTLALPNDMKSLQAFLTNS